MILGEKGFRLTDILIDFRAFHRISQEGPPADSFFRAQYELSGEIVNRISGTFRPAKNEIRN